jgi:N-acetylmuramoyl-L-alanine amidase
LEAFARENGIVTEQKPEKATRKFTIVIDAGHGGKDTGAIGPNALREKDVVLAIAIKLARKINSSSNMRAVLTRNGDYYVPLRQRLKLARKGDADVFVAIHADAYYRMDAKGSSVFALSQRAASSEAARWLAQTENHTELDGVEFNQLKDRSTMLRSVLIDLAQTVTIQDSVRLGGSVLDALRDIGPLHYKKVEQAPFIVLKSPDIPSILVETGFISNPREAARLGDSRYQQQIANAIYQGLTRYAAQVAYRE